MTTPPPTPVPSVRSDEVASCRGPRRCVNSASAAALAVVDHADRQAEPRLEHLPEPRRRGSGCSRRRARPRSAGRRAPERRTPPRRRPARAAPRPSRRARRASSSCDVERASAARERSHDVPGVVDHPGEDLRPAEVDADDTPAAHPAGTLLRRMAPKEKPYRVYRGRSRQGQGADGRPAKTRPSSRATGAGAAERGARQRVRASRCRRPSWKLAVLIVLLARAAARIVWGVTGYLSVLERRLGREQALRPRARREARARDEQRASCSPRHDDPAARHRQRRPSAGRSGDRHSDSIMLLRTDPSHHRLSYLSIPRDLLVPIPGVGNAKINAAFQIGGAALAIRTIQRLHGRPDQPRRDRRLRRASRI